MYWRNLSSPLRVQLAQWLASPLRHREVASSIPGCVSYSVFAIICNKFARQACGKLAASSFHGDFGAFGNLLQACTLVMTNLWQACFKLELLSRTLHQVYSIDNLHSDNTFLFQQRESFIQGVQQRTS
ncbi:hypothetical protein AVEN_48781-1 [Araneus ventricosus]|uniref:Uncharacterized protein n=1 Tax=Araneus ventricosus TaxID=182803 RepID=A0A4Y2LUB1_ARAVE|nr:hypothetical protein AVEN_48781-1 [Araneus ventricosus]